ncbi:MAG: hypothetical protein M3N68_04025 [Actinomycetota bacterium]|nr:hypothetical protein [Actinomycetota bacterium]
MDAWIANNNVAYHMYFEYDVPTGEPHEMMTGNFALAAARFLELFGATGGPATTTTTAALATSTTAPPITTTTTKSLAGPAATALWGKAIKRTIDLAWTPSTSSVARYKVYRATSPSGPFILVGTTTGTKQGHADGGTPSA